MKLIPAIDLKDGCVVHARGGDRRRYRRLELPLFPSAQPLDVIARLLDGAAPGPPDTVYVADLDAIAGDGTGTGDNTGTGQYGDIAAAGKNRAAIADIRRRFPALRVWLDTGVRRRRDIAGPQPGVLPVVGTETLADDLSLFNDTDYILSLDFDAKRPPDGGLLQRPGAWPHTVIALMLGRVGAQCGPDIARLKPLRARHRGRLIAGGGVRDERDLRALQACGVDGALAATAIYHGRLRRAG
ncbi:MAG: HisA/HisF-related TIM barrel protein [Gammaproteobacteria bacterium]|nr:HisA/HisF-related TIM barrel protein [Gammaproteobacteria bacterium]